MNKYSEDIKAYIDTHINSMPTPALIFDINGLRENYNRLTSLVNWEIFYAVKANPADEIIHTLGESGASFDVASIQEIESCLNQGISPDRLSYANTVKKVSEIKKAYEYGVRLFVFDSISELEKISEHAPRSKVMCRILTNDHNETSAWSLSKKFGCSDSMAYDLMLKAQELDLEPYAIAYHVGSQCITDIGWKRTVKTACKLYERLEKVGVKLDVMNIGGGLPVRYKDSPNVNSQDLICAIERIIDKNFKRYNINPKIMAEPGRYLVADCSVLVSEVVNTSQRREDDIAWAYFDSGRYNGLIETVGDSIQFFVDIYGKENDLDLQPYILAGNTCDSFDTWYESTYYDLPKSLTYGDRAIIYPTGAYVNTCASRFNGFDVPREIFLNKL